MTARARRLLKIAVSVALIVGLVYFLDTDSLAEAARGVNGGYVLIAFVMVILNRIIMPFKWNLLLRARSIRLSHYDAIRIYTISSFLGIVLPPTVGADSVRGYYTKQAGIPLSDAIASIVIERMLGLVVLLLFTVAGFSLLIHLLRDGAIDVAAFAGVLGVLSFLIIVGVYISFTPRFQQLVTSVFARVQNTRIGKLARGADSFVQAYQDYRNQKRALALFSALTALELCVIIVRSYVVGLSLGVELPVYVYFAFLPLVIFLNRMPISFDGFGIMEGLFTYFLGLFGVMHEKGFLIGLFNHLLFILGVLPGGLFYIFWGREKKSPMRS